LSVKTYGEHRQTWERFENWTFAKLFLGSSNTGTRRYNSASFAAKLGYSMTDPVTANISVRSINHEILGIDGPNHLISQILPPIAIVNPSSYRLHAMNNRLTFSSVSPGYGRLGIFAAQKGSQQRAMILLLPPAGAPDRLMICITQGFAQASRNLEPLGWGNPLSAAFVNFCLAETPHQPVGRTNAGG
jgi:hypothetical protein